MPEVSTRHSCMVSKEKLDKHQIDVVCEHAALSLRAQNQPYQVIDKRDIQQEVNVIDEVYLNYLLDAAASAYDMDASWPSGDGMRRVWRKITESPAYNDGLRAIRDRMSRM